MALDDCTRCSIGFSGDQKDAIKLLALGLSECYPQRHVAKPLAPMTRGDIVANVPTVFEKERSGDVVAQTCHAHDLAIARAEPTVSARNPAIAQVETTLLIEKALNVCGKVDLGWRV